ncbi:MAG: STAS domain-containing protein [Gammaproteobacteria bacterium]|jgi:ABC-type transporter Mla MlaB component|nr:STAS domain-containing protein [Gammaproteobacteria bacterium]MBT3723518.1 STAS domain-containing protein [Gammaproteobacteria bacterium]MBT4076900.1 STAS domain-containing protein [Gammaproteobacteria bacterium]MBT4194274.1 STAS domain-containing protein [Gammaproteobacteria bacterium]MBT4450828.1 STAS domain-containing protein [Gammaproteobacteria bacterium]
MDVEVSFDNSNQYIQVKGDLTSKTVMSALKQFSRECKTLPKWVIDFTQVTKVDSSAIAMLIELKRNALKNKKSISFIYLPAALLKIARLSQVEDLLKEKP